MTQNKTKQANCLLCRASRPCPSLLLLWLKRLHDLQNREPTCPSSALQSEQDLSTQRNAFQMLCNHAQDRAVNYLLAQTDNVAQWGDILQMSVLELIRKVGKAQLRKDPAEKHKFMMPHLSCSCWLPPAGVPQGCCGEVLVSDPLPAGVPQGPWRVHDCMMPHLSCSV